MMKLYDIEIQLQNVSNEKDELNALLLSKEKRVIELEEKVRSCLFLETYFLGHSI